MWEVLFLIYLLGGYMTYQGNSDYATFATETGCNFQREQIIKKQQ